MSIQFSKVLTRADISFFQDVLGTSQTELLQLISGESLRIADMRILLDTVHSEIELMQNQVTRNRIFELLRKDEAESLCKVLSIDSQSNPFVPLLSLSIRKGSKREHALLSFFKIERNDKEDSVGEPATISIDPQYALFAHQSDAAHKVIVKMNEEPHRCILHMPTGSGKTRTAMNIIAQHLRQTDGFVVWLAYSSELCDQAAEEFEKAWSHLGDRSLQINKYWGNHSVDISTVKNGLLIAGFGKLYQHFKDNYQPLLSLGDSASLVVVDEAHQSIAPTYKIVIDCLTRRPSTYLLGLTATPGRTTDDIGEDLRLSSYFSKKKVMLEIDGFTNPIDFLVSEGYLAAVEYRTLDYENGIQLTKTELASISNSLDIPPSVLYRLATHSIRNIRIMYVVNRLIEEGHKRIILFATTVEHAKEIAALLTIQGVQSDYVVGDSDKSQRTTIINQYKTPTSTPFVLCNYGVLTTGFDAPQTSAAVIARPTKSLVLYSQMVGRAIRGVKAGGNKRAVVVTTADFELPGFRSVAEAFSNWEDVYSE